MGRARVRHLQDASRRAPGGEDCHLYDRGRELAQGLCRRADHRARPRRAADGAPDRRVVQHGAHPPGGSDVRGDDQGLVLPMRWLCTLLAFAATVAGAQPVTHLIVPFAAGGVQDIVARSINAELATALGRTVIVENRAGAGGTIGAALVAKSPPDGQTVILAAASHTIAGSLYAKLPYDPLKDFTPLAHLGNVDYVLLVAAAVPATKVREFVAYAKANPGKLNYASAAHGSATELSIASFSSPAGRGTARVQYQETGEGGN